MDWRHALPRHLGYVVGRFVRSIPAFVLAVTGLALGLGLAVVVAGLPVGAATLRVLRRIGNRDRRAAAGVLATTIPEVAEPPSGRLGLSTLRDPGVWRDAAYAVVGFPVAVVAFTLALTWPVAGAGAALYPLWSWALPADNVGLVGLVLDRPAPVAEAVGTVLLGAVLVLTTPVLLRGCAYGQAHLARLLLHDEAEVLRQRNADLARSRAAAASAEGAALTRLERDLHDGPQQRLLRVGMDLDTVGRRIATDPAAAQALLGEATVQVRETLTELRGLSRGVAPPELVRHGLAAALTALAARSLVPTELEVRLSTDRLAPITERTAYFVVAECLTNVAKHAAARSARVEVTERDGRVRIAVSDDGVGGAAVGLGHGLAGLADRLRGVDGRLEVHSPAGGPTVVRAELPDA